MMKSIREIDKNFAEKTVGGRSLAYVPAFTQPIRVDGFPFYPGGGTFCRLPQEALADESINAGARQLAWHTAGGQLRFCTDSDCIGVSVTLRHTETMSHMPLTGSSGVDFYLGSGGEKRFINAARPENGQRRYEKLIELNTKLMREWTLYLPLYNGIESLDVLLAPDARILPPAPFAREDPILFYGSSITQGGCASRTGLSYQAHLSRWLDANIVNLGFSGSARGEENMARLISSLQMSAFVMDYDHNAPDAEHLEKTHAPFFHIVRRARPDLPVLLVSRPDTDANPEQSAIRRDIVQNTYRQAVAAGDRRVFFIDGHLLFGNDGRDDCTVDGGHPNDIGFLRMAQCMLPALKEALNLC